MSSPDLGDGPSEPDRRQTDLRAPQRRRSVWARRFAFLIVAQVVIAVAILAFSGMIARQHETSRKEVARHEIAQLSNAIGAFKAKFNIDYIPDGPFHLKPAYEFSEPEAVYLRQLFPQLDLKNTSLPDRVLDANQTLTFFLTGGTLTNYTGFPHNKQQPFSGPSHSEFRVGPFLEVTASRLDTDGRYLDPWGTPYVYFTSRYDMGRMVYAGTFTWNGQTVSPYRMVERYLNPKSFQIISAGPDRQFGPGGEWTPGTGPWSPGAPGGDDLSNFNQGPLSQER